MSRVIAVSAVAALALPAPQLATAAPAIEKGWPRVVPGSSHVVADVRGGAVFSGHHTSGGKTSIATLALTRRGSTRWIVDRTPVCGNCDGGAEVVAQADRTFGPIGFTGDSFWAVSGTGRVVEGCTGVVLAAGTCISHRPGIDGNRVTATRGGARLWEYVEPGFEFVSVTDAPEPLVRDASGITYIGYDRGRDPQGNPAPARVIAIDPDGSLRWRVLNPPRPGGGWGRVQGALRHGVVIETPSGVAGFNRYGRILWKLPVPANRLAGVVTDPARDRLFLLTRAKAGLRIDAVNARSGRRLWKTTAAALADVGRDGTLYVGDRLGNGSGAVRAINRRGKLMWRFRTASPVTDAAELSDHRVALSTADGLALRINPRLHARLVARSNVALVPRRIRTGCTRPGFSGRPCATGGQWGAILRMNLASPAAVAVRFVAPGGGRERLVIRAPRGRSFHRLFVGDTAIRSGASTVVASWRENGVLETRRMRVSVS